MKKRINVMNFFFIEEKICNYTMKIGKKSVSENTIVGVDNDSDRLGFESN